MNDKKKGCSRCSFTGFAWGDIPCECSVSKKQNSPLFKVGEEVLVKFLCYNDGETNLILDEWLKSTIKQYIPNLKKAYIENRGYKSESIHEVFDAPGYDVEGIDYSGYVLETNVRRIES